MFEALQAPAQDRILALMQMFADDPRPGKIDLGVGVYRDGAGLTPVMRAVKAAEHRLWQEQDSKTYTGLAGDPGFHRAMAGLIFAGSVPAERIAAVATPGGTGAFRQAMELVRLAAPGAVIWLPDPSWPNHASIIAHVGLPMRKYRYFDPANGAVDFGGTLEDSGRVAPGDVVLLHGCCHNPTGADLNPAQWAEVSTALVAKGALPLVDLAYQGFGEGLEADAAGARLLAAACPEMLLAASCSKNFGLYRERAGILMALGPAAGRGTVQGNLAWLNRQNYSFPPDHGARVVTTILNDDGLRADWVAELEAMRLNMLSLRRHLADELRRLTRSDRFGFIAQHRGMFSRLGATRDEVIRLREERGIYMVEDSRLNIAGLNPADVPVLAEAIAAVVA